MQDNVTPEEIAEVIDLDSALKRVRGNKSLYKRMLGLFVKSGEFDNFELALESGDLPKAADVAHAIKGMTANLGMTRLADLSAQLMVQLRQGPAGQELVDDYRKTLERTRKCVDSLLAQPD